MLNGDVFATACDHCFWSNARAFENKDFRHGQIVFCKIDEVWRLFRALRRTRSRIVLVTGEGDKPVTSDLYAQKPPHISHWFGTNMFAAGPDTTPVPLGLGSESDEATINASEIASEHVLGAKREKLIYANFATVSNPALREPLREWLIQPEQSWITRDEHQAGEGRAAYLKSLFTHHFVLCPPGNGEDTHRMWEALYCGAIPVARESRAMRYFKDLPVLFVEKLNSLSERSLRDILRSWPRRGSSRAKLDLDFWRGRFAAARENAQRRGRLTIREVVSAWIAETHRILRKKSVLKRRPPELYR